MGAVFEAAATAKPTRRPTSHGARRLADAAADRCLQQVGTDAGELDLLINVGVYRERGLAEPALAALIQQDVDANPGHPPIGGHGTFSFDIDNAACGVLSAVQVIRGFLTSGAARKAMVVASDSGPDPVHANQMPYAESGGALLLGWDDSVPGVVALKTATYPEFASLCEGYWTWEKARMRRNGAGGHPSLIVLERPGYLERAVDCAGEVASGLLAETGVPVGDVDLLIGSHSPGFVDLLADRIGLPRARVVHLGEDHHGAHTAEPIAAIATAMRDGRWDRARTILVVSAGSGITAAAMLYRH